jgi:hypothetical protein
VSEEGYIVEFITVGNSVKVTAFDPETLTEATVVGAPSVAREELAALAVRKLRYVIDKRQE